MSLFIYIPIIIFLVLMSYMSNKQGTQSSLSLLAKNLWLCLLIMVVSQCILLYPILEFTPINMLWIPFIGCGMLSIVGISNIFNKEDITIHMISAVVSFICFLIWVLLMNYKCIIPLLVCLASGKENIKWRIEVGMIISVYMTLLLLV